MRVHIDAIRVAHVLARLYGHAWGQIDLPDPDESGHLTPEAIVARLRSGDPDNPIEGGVIAPEVDERGVILHTTGTGRLTWEITPEPSVRLTWSRPCGDIATLYTWAGPPAGAALSLCNPGNQGYYLGDPPVVYHRRHVEQILSEIAVIRERLAAAGFDFPAPDAEEVQALEDGVTDEVEWIDRQIVALERRRKRLVEAV